MPKKLDQTHKAILDFLEKNSGGKDFGLREIAKHAKLNHPQKASNKISQLEKMGYIRKNPENRKYDIFRDNPIPEFVTIPIYSSTQFGSKGFNMPETEPIKKVKIPSDILGISGDDEYFFVKVKRESLLPIIKPNDLVLIKKEKRLVEGKKYLVIHNNKPKIKILERVGKEKWLISTNFNFDKEKPLVVKDNVKFLGTAQKIITSV